MHVQVFDEEKWLEASDNAAAGNTVHEEDKENVSGNFTPHRHSNAIKPPSSHPVTLSPLTLPEQYSAKTLASMMRVTAQHTATHALLTPRDGEGPSDTAAAAANEAVYSSLSAPSPQCEVVTPRDALVHACVERAVLATGANVTGDVGGHANPGWVSCLSGLSSPEPLHMHAQHATQVVQVLPVP
jgi:hypothetical protein